MTLESLARSSARLAAHDVLRNAAQILTRAGHVEAALILTEPDNWHEMLRSACDKVVDALPKEAPPSKLPKSWPFPVDAERALV